MESIKAFTKKETVANFTCNICDGKFRRNDNLKEYMMRSHETVFKDNRCIEVRTMSNFPGCTESFFRKVDFVKHLTDRHNIVCFVESYNFKSELEFQSWKEKEEVKYLVYFGKQRGYRCGKKFQYVYYNFQRDGAQIIHKALDKKDYHKKRKVQHGNVKRNSFCPGSMVLTF